MLYTNIDELKSEVEILRARRENYQKELSAIRNGERFVDEESNEPGYDLLAEAEDLLTRYLRAVKFIIEIQEHE